MPLNIDKEVRLHGCKYLMDDIAHDRESMANSLVT